MLFWLLATSLPMAERKEGKYPFPLVLWSNFLKNSRCFLSIILALSTCAGKYF